MLQSDPNSNMNPHPYAQEHCDTLPLISIKNLNFSYHPGVPVLKDFSFTLVNNEIVGLIGLNGAGKTTLMNIMSGILPHYDSSELLFSGKPLDFQDVNFKHHRYTVFAEDYSFGYFTFEEYIHYVFHCYQQKCPDLSELLHGFHFEEYTNRLLSELSTGNRKKAFLITAFALHPTLLLLDEPVNGLDFQSTEFLYSLIQNYKQYGTLLFSSHILESICMTSDRVIVLENGSISQQFTQDHINSDRIREVLHEE